MIVRLVLVAAVTASLLAASMPAISVARHDRAEATAERQFRALAARLQSLVAANDPTAGAGARLAETVHLPSQTLTSAGVEWVRFHERDGKGIVSWQVGTQRRSLLRLVSVPIRSGDDPSTLTESGSHNLVFGLHLRNGTSVVTVDRQSAASARNSTDA